MQKTNLPPLEVVISSPLTASNHPKTAIKNPANFMSIFSWQQIHYASVLSDALNAIEARRGVGQQPESYNSDHDAQSPTFHQSRGKCRKTYQRGRQVRSLLSIRSHLDLSLRCCRIA
jgi:hypothetical protein